MNKLIFIELNEINFDNVKYYIEQGKLPTFKTLLEKYSLFTTKSEKKYEELEPWIQWVTIRTGKTYNEHKVFRLGDITESKLKQHWEILEEKGYTVAAISPINGANRTVNSPFWIPDPWVDTAASGNSFILKFSDAVRQAVNDNAQEKLTFKTKFVILQALLFYSRVKSIPVYIKNIIGALKGYHWSKALIFERLLSDVFINLWKKHKPDFTSVFFNTGAHLQHHYFYSSAAYKGTGTNPSWYIPNGKDPILEVLELYDQVIKECMELGARVFIATGLVQIPYPENTFYYRLKDHDAFIKKMNINYKRIIPRMSRDFLIEFDSTKFALEAEIALKEITGADGEKIFSVDNRGNTLFVMLSYSKEIKKEFNLLKEDKSVILNNFEDWIIFVAIKNGHHAGKGYFIDSGIPKKEEKEIELKSIFDRVIELYK